jgi:CRISPR-associated exonuclease Cas4
MAASGGNGAGDDEPVPLSALQHYLFCPRQCALIHVERQWAENRFTAEGRILHEAADVPSAVSRRDLKVVRGMPIASAALGVAGVADVVELRREGGRWRPFPVEYKRGRPKAHRADEVQLCAQAIALEEMFRTAVPEGALFYGKTRRRISVSFDEELRALTREVAARTREMIAEGRTPPPVFDKSRCEPCSLIELCRPKAMQRHGRVDLWLARQIAAAEDGG